MGRIRPNQAGPKKPKIQISETRTIWVWKLFPESEKKTSFEIRAKMGRIGPKWAGPKIQFSEIYARWVSKSSKSSTEFKNSRFTSLPWKLETEEAETLAQKQRFWTHLNQYFQANARILPPHLYSLAHVVMGPIDGHVYNKLTAILKDGFLKNSEGGGAGWKPSWVDKRKKMGGLVMPNMKRKKKEKKK